MPFYNTDNILNKHAGGGEFKRYNDFVYIYDSRNIVFPLVLFMILEYSAYDGEASWQNMSTFNKQPLHAFNVLSKMAV